MSVAKNLVFLALETLRFAQGDKKGHFATPSYILSFLNTS